MQDVPVVMNMVFRKYSNTSIIEDGTSVYFIQEHRQKPGPEMVFAFYYDLISALGWTDRYKVIITMSFPRMVMLIPLPLSKLLISQLLTKAAMTPTLFH
jgi:hypothetical protein